MKYGAIARRRGHRCDGQLLGRVYSAGPHHAAKKRTEPYTKIIDVLPTMRRDTVNLVNQSIEETGVCVGEQSVGRKRAADVQALVERLQTDS